MDAALFAYLNALFESADVDIAKEYCVCQTDGEIPVALAGF